MNEPPATASSAGYLAPASVDEALAVLAADPSSTVIAGGTDLIPSVRSGEVRTGVLVDLRRLPLTHVTFEHDRVRLGARVTFTDILSSPELVGEYPALVAAAEEVGGPPIRNRATLGGNLVNASPAADGAPPLLAYDAVVVLAGPAGSREVPLSEFFTGPGATVREPDEILTEVRIPRHPGSTVSSFTKLGTRQAMAVAIVSVAARLSGSGPEDIRECRIALGAVAPTPVRAQGAEGVVVARGLTPESIAEAATEAARECFPIDDRRGTAGYRQHMVGVLVRRLLNGLDEQLRREALHG